MVVVPDNETAEHLLQELQFFCGNGEDLPVFSLPDWETLPYDSFSPHQDIISERLSTLYRLPGLQRGVLVVSVPSLMHRLPPMHYVAANSLDLERGQRIDMKELRGQLALAGYSGVESVYEHGEFAVRGSIIDLFPMGSPHPFRLDLFDDDLDSIRIFDPESQRSSDRVDSIKLLAGREYPLDEAGIMEFRARFRERFDVDLRQCPLYQDVSDGLGSPGLEYYLALFFPRLSMLSDYLPDNTIVVKMGDPSPAGEQFWSDIEARHGDRSHDRYRPILNPDEIFVPVSDVLRELKQFSEIRFSPDSKTGFGSAPLPDLASNARLARPFQKLEEFLQAHQCRVLFCAESAGRREALLQLLKQIEIQPREVSDWHQFLDSSTRFGIAIAPMERGMLLQQEDIALVSETQLLGERVAQRRRRSRNESNTEFIVKSLTELHIDDAVVHLDHGVGRYRGLETITTDGQATEFLTLEYAGGSKLYVPVSSLHLISRYSGAEQEAAPLHSLGSDLWQKTKRRAAEKIRDVATELLDIYARRQAKKGYAYGWDEADYERFCAAFPFEETPDQDNAIAAVLDDMGSTRAMDRLICGDVGFGKTEVAMRAAFVAVSSGKQVAMLVPTTLLAQQHFESFQDRFANWPFVVEVISRFKTSAEQKKALQQVAQGKIDILIGTHKLLNSDIDYSNLGLLIIDEEHRFGVRQKEKLKSIRANVDILTLTATPIPRTLNMALSGIRDLSLIVTPPARRLSVKTFVREQQDGLIKEAVSRELLRGGQVFYLHNEVKTIDRAADHIRELIPQARVAVAHGQMPERELEKVMKDFYHKRYNILVCTTIIETGIDIPSANTIVIHRADKFGLAQLHQLRGRVGRSHHQAYAYLLLPSYSRLGRDAEKRIEAIQAATTLGAGFTLASHDLEIRGAGELLGEEQSGHMQKIGFSLYTEMLEEAVDAIKAGRTPSVDLEAEKAIDINLRIPALIPETYLPDVHTRLIMYKRISACSTEGELNELQVEMIDRFGLLPEPLKLLFRLTGIKLRAQDFGIGKIDMNVSSGRMEFTPSTRIDPLSLVQLIQQEADAFKLGGANQLQFKHDCDTAETKLDLVESIMDRFRLTEKAAA